MAQGVEHPPQARRRAARTIVVGHDRVSGPMPRPPMRAANARRVRQRMAAQLPWRRVVRQVRVQVHEHGPRDVTRRVLLPSPRRCSQVPARIADDEPPSASRAASSAHLDERIGSQLGHPGRGSLRLIPGAGRPASRCGTVPRFDPAQQPLCRGQPPAGAEGRTVEVPAALPGRANAERIRRELHRVAR